MRRISESEQASNFCHLSEYDAGLATLGSFAERYFVNNANTALNKTRQFAEQLSVKGYGMTEQAQDIPTFGFLLRPILHALHAPDNSISDVRKSVADAFNFPYSKIHVAVPAGTKNNFHNNFDVALSWLKKCGLPAAVRKCSIARLLEVADMYPACDRLEYFAVALLGVRTRRCLISDLIYDDHLGSQTLGAPYSVPYN